MFFLWEEIMDLYTIRVRGTDKVAKLWSTIDGIGEYSYLIHIMNYVPLSEVDVLWTTPDIEIAKKAIESSDYFGSYPKRPYHEYSSEHLEVVSISELMSDKN
jgi:hypothetical protein